MAGEALREGCGLRGSPTISGRMSASRRPGRRRAAAVAGVAMALVLAFVSSTPASAETARIRSGDHGTFTRLVIELAVPADWRFGRTASGYALDFGRPDVTLEMAGLFDAIPRSRVAAAAQRDGRFEIALGCGDCHAMALDYRGSWIVIDVANGPPPPGSPFEAPLGAGPAVPDRAAGAPQAVVPAPGAVSAGSAAAAATGNGPARSIRPRPAAGRRTAAPGDAVAALAAGPAPSLGSAWSGAPRAETLRPPPGAAVPPGAAATRDAPADSGAETAADVLAGDPADRGPTPLPALPSVLAPVAQSRPWLDEAGRVPAAIAALTQDGAEGEGGARPGESPLEQQRLRLLEEVSRAASQGLLEADLPAVDRARRPFAAPDAGPPPQENPQSSARRPDPVDHVRLEADTSIDRDTRAARPDGGATPDGVGCIADTLLDLAAWGDAADPAEGLSRRRGALLGEFDRPVPGAVLDLARYYVYLGFGAEARATLATFGGGPDQAADQAADEGADEGAEVAAMAAVIDGEAAALPGVFAGQAGCPGRAALWGTLAAGGPPGDGTANARAVIGAFAELPVHLRRHLGPELAIAFLDAGDTETALALRDAAVRGAGEAAAAFALFDAALGLAEGDAAAASGLAALAGSGDAQGARAYAAFLEGELSAGRVPEAGSATADALAFEIAATEEGRRLAALALGARLAEGDFEGARQELLRRTAEAVPPAEGQPPDAVAAADWTRFADAITRGAADGEFLRQAFAARDAFGDNLQRGPVATALALRLTGLGFGEEALRYLPRDPAGEAERLAAAEALLQTGSASAAFGVLAGLSGPAAERLRARALLELGDARGAAARFAAAGDDRMAERAAWQAGAWDRLAEAEDPAIRRLAGARAEQPASRGGSVANGIGTAASGARPVLTGVSASAAGATPGQAIADRSGGDRSEEATPWVPAVSEPAAPPDAEGPVSETDPAATLAAGGREDLATGDGMPGIQPAGRVARARAALEAAREARDIAQALLSRPVPEVGASPEAGGTGQQDTGQ